MDEEEGEEGGGVAEGRSLGISAQQLLENAKLGPVALLRFLNWEKREKHEWTMTTLMGELNNALQPHSKVFYKDKKKWPHPGKAWIKVKGKPLQKEVDRMLEHIYDAVRIAGGIDGMLGPQQPQMGAGLSNIEEEEEDMDEQP